jgi:hypothetical protein
LEVVAFDTDFEFQGGELEMMGLTVVCPVELSTFVGQFSGPGVELYLLSA